MGWKQKLIDLWKDPKENYDCDDGDDERSRRPSTVTSVVLKEHIYRRNQDNRRMNTAVPISELSSFHEKTRCKYGLKTARKHLLSHSSETSGSLDQIY
jgi:hypothetical protein